MDDNRIPALISKLPVNREIKKLRDDRKKITVIEFSLNYSVR